MRTLCILSVLAIAGCGGTPGGVGGPAAGNPPALFLAGQNTGTATVQVNERRVGVNNTGSGLRVFTRLAATPNGTGDVGWDGTQVTSVDTPGTINLAQTTTLYGQNAVQRRGTGYATYTGSGPHQRAFAFWSRTSGTSWNMGAASVGNRTVNAANLPASAHYTGTLVGQYLGSTGTHYATSGPLSMNVDFRRGTYSMGTGTIRSVNTRTSLPVSAPGLPFTSTGNVNGTVFAGSANGAAGTLSGQVSGNFYGPSGEQAGGTFSMSGGAGTHIGAFSAQR